MHWFAELEKRKDVWFLIVISFLFFLLRLPSVFEPYWYGDEGIYEVIGQALRHGRLLYTGIWDNKPPFLYLVYAFFDGNQPAVKTASLLVGLLSVIVFFLFSQKLYKNLKISMVTTTLFTLLFGLPILEGNIANAENFMILPILISCYLIYSASVKHLSSTDRTTSLQSHLRLTPFSGPFYLAGFLLGMAFLFKIVALFDIVTCLFFIFFSTSTSSHFWRPSIFVQGLRKSIPMLLPFGIGVLLLPGVTFFYFLIHGAALNFLQATFFSNIGYVGYGNAFLFPQGLLIIKLLLLVSYLIFLLQRRKMLSKPAFFLLLWLGFSLFNVFFSQRPYIHYLLVFLPSFSLSMGYLFLSGRVRKFMALFLVIIIFLVFRTFRINDLTKPVTYYFNYLSFLTHQKSVHDYRAFFDPNVPRDYAVAQYLTLHMNPKDQVYLWGNSPQIYVLSHRVPLGKYTVAYHVNSKAAVSYTQKLLSKNKPKYLVILENAGKIPFAAPEYNYVFTIDNAYIYERFH